MIRLASYRAPRKPAGVVLYEGPSVLDGAPIVCIATLHSENEKTGDMIQTWIIRRDVNPIEAINTGLDGSVCGNCPLRGIVKRIKETKHYRNLLRGCYVVVRNAPYQVFRAYRAGRYPHYSPAMHAHLFAGRRVRLGSYGDPTACPIGVWQSILSLASGHTGYTHQWQRFPEYRPILMASVDTESQATDARRAGWRYFRTLLDIGQLGTGERSCPASAEGGKRTQCERCGACRGAGSNLNRASIAIVAHGSPAVLSSYRKLTSR